MRRYSRRALMLGAVIGTTPLRAAGEGTRVAVKDQTGAGVEGAVVILSQHQTVKPRSGEADIPTVAAIGTTDKDGIAEFPVDEVAQKRAIKGQRYTVEVRCYGFQPATRTGVIATTRVVDVVLRVGFFVIY